MNRLLTAIGYLVLSGSISAADVLIVVDEFPAVEVLAAKLKAEENIDSKIVAQTNLPADLSSFRAVIVYIHKDLHASAERAFIDYTQAGGRLLPLHHSISSGKRKNKDWFKFLGVDLPAGDLGKGGYKWIEGVTLELVNLATNHFITANKLTYPEQITWKEVDSAGEGQPRASVTLQHTEVYLNHVLTKPHTLLLGFKYTDAKSGQVYRQTHAGWIKPSGKGLIVYLMPGHSSLDFENPVYSRIVLNAVVYQP